MEGTEWQRPEEPVGHWRWDSEILGRERLKKAYGLGIGECLQKYLLSSYNIYISHSNEYHLAYLSLYLRGPAWLTVKSKVLGNSAQFVPKQHIEGLGLGYPRGICEGVIFGPSYAGRGVLGHVCGLGVLRTINILPVPRFLWMAYWQGWALVP